MRARGYIEAVVVEGGEERPLAQVPPDVPRSDDAPTLCVRCLSALANCACGSTDDERRRARVARYQELWPDLVASVNDERNH